MTEKISKYFRLSAMALATAGFVLCSLVRAQSPSDKLPAPEVVQIISKDYTIDHLTKSMEGPTGSKPFRWLRSPKPELVWVIGGKVEILDEQNRPKENQGQLCHAYMKYTDRWFTARNPNARMRNMTHQMVRLLTFVQGQPEIHFPTNYALPLLSRDLMEFSSMVINPTPVDKPSIVKAKGTFEFYRDSHLPQGMKPLFMRIAGQKVRIKAGTAPMVNCDMEGMNNALKSQEDDSAEPAKISLKTVRKNENGYEQAYHWMVPPGRHTYRYRFEKSILGPLPFDTTLHYLNVHLHAYGESVELRDATTDKTLFKSYAQNNNDHTAVTKIDYFSSEEGLPIYRSHDYEMVTVYNNTTPHEIDAMSVMFLYLLDKTFDKQQLKLAEAPLRP